MNKELIKAYYETDFNVFNPAITIKIGVNNDLLNNLLFKHGVDEWAYITPFNPYSKVLSKEQNEQRYKDLKNKIVNYKYFEGEGVGTGLSWKPEKSFLIFGITKEKAIEFGNEYEQNAIVYGIVYQLPKLLILRSLLTYQKE